MSGTDNFEPLERARGRGGYGGFKGIFGIIPSVLSCISENMADDFSEAFYRTSGRKGRKIAHEYKDYLHAKNIYDKSHKEALETYMFLFYATSMEIKNAESNEKKEELLLYKNKLIEDKKRHEEAGKR